MGPKVRTIRNLYLWGRITLEGLRQAVKMGDITPDDFFAISKIEYTEK